MIINVNKSDQVQYKILKFNHKYMATYKHFKCIIKVTDIKRQNHDNYKLITKKYEACLKSSC